MCAATALTETLTTQGSSYSRERLGCLMRARVSSGVVNGKPGALTTIHKRSETYGVQKGQRVFLTTLSPSLPASVSALSTWSGLQLADVYARACVRACVRARVCAVCMTWVSRFF